MSTHITKSTMLPNTKPSADHCYVLHNLDKRTALISVTNFGPSRVNIELVGKPSDVYEGLHAGESKTYTTDASVIVHLLEGQPSTIESQITILD